MVNVKCDECSEQFDIRNQEKDHGKGIIETYFICPHCQHRYISFVTDSLLRTRDLPRVKRMYKQLQGIHDKSKYKRKLKQIEELEQKNKNRMIELMKQVASR